MVVTTFQGREVWMQAKQITIWTKSGWVQWGMVFDSCRCLAVKMAPVTHLVLNWKPTSSACEVNHNNPDYIARWIQLSQKPDVPFVT